jgi:lysine 6-dehydrogenase
MLRSLVRFQVAPPRSNLSSERRRPGSAPLLAFSDGQQHSITRARRADRRTFRLGAQAEKEAITPRRHLERRHPEQQLLHPTKRLIRVAVVGSSSVVPLLTASLSEHPEVSQVVAASREGVGEAISQSSVVIGCLVPGSGHERDVALAATAAGVPYISSSDSPDDFQALWELRDRAAEARSLIVTGMGWTPGITNLMAAAGAAALDEPLAVRVAWVGSAAGAGAKEILRKAVSALNGVAMVFESDSWVLQEAGGRPEQVYLPEPLGWSQVRLCAAVETLSLPSTISGVQQVTVHAGLAEPITDQLVRGASSLGRYVPARRLAGWTSAAARIFPPGPSGGGVGQPWSGVRVDVTGLREGSKSTVTYGLVDLLPNLMVAPLIVAALNVGRSQDVLTGVLPPEVAFEPMNFFGGLAERGVRVATLERDTFSAHTMVPPGP